LGFPQTQKLTNFAKEQNLNISYRVKTHVTPIFLARKNQIFYPNFKINLDSDIFIQATKSGLQSIIKIIRNFLEQNKNIKNIADIYAGFGAYTFAIQDLAKEISAFEGEEKMIALINKNAAANNLAKIKSSTRDLFLDPIRASELKKFELAIINPPRNGAAPQISEISKSSLKNVIYVSCNPESFKRDAEILIDSGFKITNLTALDQFYSTKHLELVAIMQKNV
jgi:23S rRNA (uracil1939-C5)-methyltransferase